MTASSFWRKTKKIAYFVRQGAEIPDVCHRNDETDVSHTFAANFLLCHFNGAAVADDALVADTLVLAAMAFVVLDRTENALAEQTVALGLVRAVVDGLRFEDLTARLIENLFRAMRVR